MSIASAATSNVMQKQRSQWDAPFDGGGVIGVPSPLRLFVNHVLTLCSVMPSVSPSGPRASAPLFIATSASLHIRDSSSR